jgi:hypothetical protein
LILRDAARAVYEMLYLTELRLDDNLLASSPLVRPKAYTPPTPRLLTLSELRTRFAKPTGYRACLGGPLFD